MSDERDQLLNISLKLAEVRMALAKAERRLEKSRAKWRAISSRRGVRLVMKVHRLWERLRAKARTLLAGGKAENPMAAELNRLLDIARKLPKSNGSRFYVKRDVRIGIVCDRFMWDAIHPAADFVYIRPTRKGLAVLDTIDLFLVCSTWEGLHHREWRNSGKAGTGSNRLLLLMMDRCRARGKKVAFYSKEDPIHYAKFLNVARHADVIFTSAMEMIPSYRRDCGHDRVHSLIFCINPELHNPIGSCGRDRSKAVLFAGSWRSIYRQRCEDQRMMFDGVLAAGLRLRIVNRYDCREVPKHAFPEAYRPFEWPSVVHGDLMALHKLFDWAININTVTTSETMSANRICELLASGNLLLSNFSKVMPKRYPGAIIVRTPADVKEILRTKTDPDLAELRASGIRRMMTGETCYDRIDQILDKVGLPQTPRSRRVLVVCRQRTAAVIRAFAEQTYPDRELMSIDEVTPEAYGRFDMVMWFSEDGIYDKFRLEDLSNAFKYANVDFVTMGSDRPHDYVPAFKNRYNTLFWREALPLERLQDPETMTFAAGGYCVSCIWHNTKSE